MKDRNNSFIENYLSVRNKEKNFIQLFPVFSNNESFPGVFPEAAGITCFNSLSENDLKNDPASSADIDTPVEKRDNVFDRILTEYEENNYYCLWC